MNFIRLLIELDQEERYMHQVILIEPVETMREIITLNLQNYLGLVVIPHKSAEETIALLELLPSISLIIARTNLGNELPVEKILKYKLENNLKTEIIALGESKSNAVQLNCIVISNPGDWKNIVRIAGKTLGITAESMASKIVPEYFPMKAKFLLILPTAPCDIYIRIKKEAGVFQYVKRIHENDTFKREDIARYIEMGLTEFYVSKDLRLNVTNIISDQLVVNLKKDLSESDRVEVTGKAFDFVNEQIRSIGFNSATTQLVEGVVDSMAKTIVNVTKKSQIFSLMRNLLVNTGSLAYRHAHMISLIASTIVKNSEWGNEEQVRKIAFVAFFHDIALDSDNLVMIHSDEDLQKSSLSASDREKVLTHAVEAARLIISYPDLPMGAEAIIRQHHGVSNGIGFAKHIAPSVSPLAAIFVAAEEFVLEVIKRQEAKEKVDPIAIVEIVKERLSGAQVKKAIGHLEQSFKHD